MTRTNGPAEAGVVRRESGDPTPTASTNPGLVQRKADFATVIEALEYAARGRTGFNFYDSRGRLSEVLSYADLADRAHRLGRRLAGLGLPRLARVAIPADTSAEFVTLFFACHYAALLPVPLPVLRRPGSGESWIEHLRSMIRGSGASAAIGAAEFQPVLRLAAEDKDKDLRFVGTPADLEAVAEGTAEIAPLGTDEFAYLQYSSGSTRAPLGVAATQRALISNCSGILSHGVRIADGDRVASWLPMYHDMGLVGCMLTALMCQISADYIAPETFALRPLLWLELIGRNRCTVAFSPTFGYELCTRRAERSDTSDLDLGSWRVAGLGGEMIREEVLAQFAERFAGSGFRAASFLPSYGLAEFCLAATFPPHPRTLGVDRVDSAHLEGEQIAVPATMNGHAVRSRGFVKCGHPLPGHAVEIRDDAGCRLGDRRIGGVFLRGPSMMSEYFGDAEATRRVLCPDGWLDTGDLGYMVDGELVITGRRKDLIIVNGRNTWPEDIEWSVERLSEMRGRKAAAFAVMENGDAETMVILVESGLADDAERRELRREVRKTVVVEFGIDCRVVLVPPRSLPYTTSGKLSRFRAREDYLSRWAATKEDGASVPPAQETAEDRPSDRGGWDTWRQSLP